MPNECRTGKVEDYADLPGMFNEVAFDFGGGAEFFPVSPGELASVKKQDEDGKPWIKFQDLSGIKYEFRAEQAGRKTLVGHSFSTREQRQKQHRFRHMRLAEHDSTHVERFD